MTIKFQNVYAPNARVPNNLKQMLMDLKGDRDINTVIMGNFKTLLSLMDRSTRQNLTKK